MESIPLRDETFQDTEFVDVGPTEMNLSDEELLDSQHSGMEWSEETYESRITKEEAYVHMQRDMDGMCFTIQGYTLEDKDFTDKALDSCIGLLRCTG